MERQYVGIDLHRRRSLVARVSAEGELVSAVRLENDPVAIAAEVAKAGESPEVVLEASHSGPVSAPVGPTSGGGGEGRRRQDAAG